MNKKIVYIDMDGVLCDFKTAYLEARDSQPHIEFPHSKPGFFTQLEPIENALESVNILRSRKDLEVYILTAPSTRNPHCYTEKRIWVEQKFDYAFTKRLILSPNKALLIGDYLIDDYASGKGQDGFKGDLLHFGSKAFPDWQTVMSRFSII